MTEATPQQRNSSNRLASPQVTPNQPATTGLILTLWRVLKVAFLISTLSFGTYASQLALHPLYGETVTSLHFDYVVAGAMCLSMILPTSQGNEGSLLNLLSLVLALAPYSAFNFGARTARWGEVTLGPVIAQLPLSVPIVLAGSMLVRVQMCSLLNVSHSSRLFRALVFGGTYAWMQMMSTKINAELPRGVGFSSCNIFFALSGGSLLFSFVDVITSASPSQHEGRSSRSGSLIPVKLAACALALSSLYVSKTNRPCNTPVYPYVAGKNGQVRILAAADSVTGMVLVGESLNSGFRYLRCDHSLLGGVWIGEDKVAAISTTKYNKATAGGVDLQGDRLGDSIYTAFLLQDGMRLFKRGAVADRKTEPESALVIGLGAGIMARSLTLLDITPTIVEIDPVVHEYAERFFALPKQPPVNDTDGSPFFIPPRTPQTHFMDARTFVDRRAAILSGMRRIREAMRYDYVVHDCFSGGMVPTHIFTQEFWASTKAVMKLDGILAVNFAGKLASNAARAILLTLESSFDKCRIFHDRIQPAAGEEGFTEHEFLNMVFFCTQSPDIDLSLRPPKNVDYVDSLVRRYIFQHFETLEVPRSRLLGEDVDEHDSIYILTDAQNPLREWQLKSAVEHWSLMRQVLPDETWETY
ncbi:hypothetical protein FRB99_005021 [Tulasnella sp. 403]|nr:hypothetical protein FRB99_005021 [Tulasnella sp. 403]